MVLKLMNFSQLITSRRICDIDFIIYKGEMVLGEEILNAIETKL